MSVHSEGKDIWESSQIKTWGWYSGQNISSRIQGNNIILCSL